MQKRKIDDSKVFESYRRLMAGESLTKVANSEDINLNRGTLRKYIQEIVVPTLSMEEKTKFEQLMNKNYRGNSTENKRKNRTGKKKKAEEEIYQSEAIKKLAIQGVTPKQIEELYERLKTNKRTSLAKDTFIHKYVEHLEFLLSNGFTVDEAFELFIRRPNLFTADAKAFQKSFELIAQSSKGENPSEKLKQNPWVVFKIKNNKTQAPDERGEK